MRTTPQQKIPLIREPIDIISQMIEWKIASQKDFTPNRQGWKGELIRHTKNNLEALVQADSSEDKLLSKRFIKFLIDHEVDDPEFYLQIGKHCKSLKTVQDAQVYFKLLDWRFLLSKDEKPNKGVVMPSLKLTSVFMKILDQVVSLLPSCQFENPDYEAYIWIKIYESFIKGQNYNDQELLIRYLDEKMLRLVIRCSREWMISFTNQDNHNRNIVYGDVFTCLGWEKAVKKEICESIINGEKCIS